MKNLKRALSFALATVMLIGMMVVGVSAASFGDADEIVNTDAVNTMVSLGIIKGKDDGNFDPEGIVTRAEMAKMICVAMNGGKDPNLAGGGLYADTKGHWASGYIDYCTNMGIVSGDTAGNFNPDKTVTGTEAAKMILIALGYNAKDEKFVNDANWALNINIVANSKDLYKDLAILPAEGLTRDNAAQMLWNGMDAKMVEYDYKLTTVDGELQTVAIAKDKVPAETILGSKFKMTTYTGVLTATGKFDLTAIGTSGASAAKDGFVVDVDKINGENAATADAKNTYFEYKGQDLTDLMGQTVKVIANNKGKVYGVYATDDNTVVAATLGDVSDCTDSTIKVNGTKYDWTSGAQAYVDETGAGFTTAFADANLKSGAAVKFIDNDGNGKFDLALVQGISVKQVTYVGKDSFAVTGASYKNADVVVYDGMEKDDVVMITTDLYTDKQTFTKIESIEGEVTATKTNAVKIDGEWYTLASDAIGSNFAGITMPGVEEDVKLFVVGKYVYSAETVSASSKDLLLVTGVGTTHDVDNYYQTKVLFPDGTSELVNAKVGSAAAVVDTLYTYEKSGDNYKLTAVSGTNKAGYDTFDNSTYGYGYDKDTKTIAATDNTAGLGINDDAIIFVKYTDNGTKYKVMSGKDLKDSSADVTLASTKKAVVLKKNSGFGYANVVFLNTDSALPGSAYDKAYGYIVSDPYTVKDGTALSVWNGTEVVDVIAASATGTLAKGKIISYYEGADDKIESVIVEGQTGFSLSDGAVVAFDSSAVKVDIDNNIDPGYSDVYELTKDTKYLFINTADVAGVAGGALQKAININGTLINNVRYLLDGSTKKVAFIVVTENNTLDATSELSVASGQTGNVDMTKKEIKVSNVATDNGTAIAAIFDNEVCVLYTTNADKCVVYAPDGTAYSFTLVTSFSA